MVTNVLAHTCAKAVASAEFANADITVNFAIALAKCELPGNQV